VDDHLVAKFADSRTERHPAEHDTGTGNPLRSAMPARIVVPVDGSPLAERALPVAAWLARAVWAPMHLLEVTSPDDIDRTSSYLDALARRHGAASWDVGLDGDPAAAIVAATRVDGPGLACMATHGRDRTAAVLGSVAADVIARAREPVMLVGRKARRADAGNAPVVAATDGTPGDVAVVAVAGDWAARLGRRLVVGTVAEPVPGSFREGRPLRRARGPDDPEGCVTRLATDAAHAWAPRVDTTVVYDPISVRSGIERLVDCAPALLVIGSHRRSRPGRALAGSHAARIVHDVEVPVLVVPLGTRM
jgi:nucleotide-binding universal stress UspA family protein